jgi:hypothetical protein
LYGRLRTTNTRRARDRGQLRQQHRADPPLARASAEVKRFQARRFQATYSDLLHSHRYKTAATFFLQELYSDKDYAERDQQFARIAGTIARLFPQPVVNTAAALAEVHALTEKLDDLMARQWLADTAAVPQSSECARYIRCWRRVGDIAAQAAARGGAALGARARPPDADVRASHLAQDDARARSGGRAEFAAAFLETGFDAFANMRGAGDFLKLIKDRETAWIHSLFEDDAVTCETRLGHLLAAGP